MTLYYRNSPQYDGKKLLRKIRNHKTAPAGDPSNHLKHSQSWDSGEIDYIMEREDGHDLPEPPLLPAVEYLLGKRQVNLRKRTIRTLKEQIQERAATMGNMDDSHDSDSHSSIGSSQSDQHKHHKRKHKKKRSVKNIMVEEQERNTAHNCLPMAKKAELGFERFPTPFPNLLHGTRFTERMPVQQKIDFDSAFDEVTNELEALVNSPSLFTPAGSSPKHPVPVPSGKTYPAYKAVNGKKMHPARQAPRPPTSHTNSATKDTVISQKSTKRGGPKLLPHQRNQQQTQNPKHVGSSESGLTSEQSKSGMLGGKFNFLRTKKQKQSHLQSSVSGQGVTALATKDPAQFINVLSQAIKSPPKQRQFMRQAGQTDTKSSTTIESAPMDIDEIESQLDEMKHMLESAAGTTASNDSRLPPSPEPARATDEALDTDSESTDDTSSCDEYTDTSGTDDSSSEDSSDQEKSRGPRRPMTARNIGMPGNLGTKGMVFNRARMLSRYPRLLGKRVIYLETVKEASEEIIFLAVSGHVNYYKSFSLLFYLQKTHQERASCFHRLRMEQKFMKEWRKYVQIMKDAVSDLSHWLLHEIILISLASESRQDGSKKKKRYNMKFLYYKSVKVTES